MQAIKKYGIVFGILLLIYMVSMMLSFCIPNSWLVNNYNMSMGEFDHGSYWHIDNFLIGTQMDGQTDKLMLTNTMKQEQNTILYNAMDVNNYPRYWHGYLILLRPLLCFFKYKYIKYMSMILCFALLCIAYRKVCELLNPGVGIGMVIAFSMGNIICIPLLMQYMSMYYITIAAVIIYCTLCQKKRILAAVCFLW